MVYMTSRSKVHLLSIFPGDPGCGSTLGQGSLRKRRVAPQARAFSVHSTPRQHLLSRVASVFHLSAWQKRCIVAS